MKAAERTRIFPVIMLALAVFAGLKLANVWIGFSEVEAQTGALIDVAAKTSTDSDAMALRDAPPPPTSPGEVERRFLENLAARRASLEHRANELSAREAVIIAAEKRLDEKIAAFEAERIALATLREEKDADDNEEIASIVSAYERMKPKDAAIIFNALDESILVPIAAGMRTQALSGVLAEMDPDNARRLTTLLAERNGVGEQNSASAGGVQ